MSTPKCEMCGRDIPNAKNRQKFCPDCVKKRQAAQSHKSYLKHREYYLERSLAQAERRKQEALEERMLEELFARKKTGTEVQHHSGGRKGKRPRHQLRLVFVSAFGRKSLYGMKGERLYDADYEVRRIDGRFCPAGC